MDRVRKRSGCYCSIALCKSSGKKEHMLSFHKFPKNPKLRKEWVLRCKRSDSWNPDTGHVCSRHFEHSAFQRDLKAELMGEKKIIRLIPGSIPTCNLPGVCRPTDSCLERKKKVIARQEEQDVDVAGSRNDGSRDVALYVINDQARVMLEHSYASLGVAQLPDGPIPSTSPAATEIEKPFRGFNNLPSPRPRLLPPVASKRAVTAVKKPSKLPNSSCKNRGAQSKNQPKPPAKRKRRKRRKRICRKKTSAKKKLVQECVSSKCNQEAFTFVGVDQLKNVNFRGKLTDFEEVKIKEEILDGSNSDTLSAPSPKMMMDSFSDVESDSFASNYLSREFIRTTIVNECNLPDNPESDPLSFAFGDLDRKDNGVINFCEYPVSSSPSAIHFNIVPKEEPEDKFVPCFGPGEILPHELTLLGHVNTDGWSAPRPFSRYSEFACDVEVKEEKLDDVSPYISSNMGSDTYRHPKLGVTKVSMSEVSMGSSPDRCSTPLKAPIGKCINVGSSTCSQSTGNLCSGLVTLPGSEIRDVNAMVPGYAQEPKMDHTSIEHTLLNYSCASQNTRFTSGNVVGYQMGLRKVSNCLAGKSTTADESIASGVDLVSNVCGSVSQAFVENNTKSVMNHGASIGTYPESSFSTKTCPPVCVQPVKMTCHPPKKSARLKNQDSERELPGGTSSKEVQMPHHRVKRKVFVVSSKKVPIFTNAVSNIVKIVRKKPQGPCGTANMPTGSTQNVPHCVQEMLVISKSLQTAAEVVPKLSPISETESQKITSQDLALPHLTDDIGKKVSPKSVHTMPKKNPDRIRRRDKNNLNFQCKSEPASSKVIHCSSQATEGRVIVTAPWTSMVPAEMKHSRVQVSPKPAERASRTPSCPPNQARLHALGNEITTGSSELDHETLTETPPSRCAYSMVPEVFDGTAAKVDCHPASVGASNQYIKSSSPLPEVHPNSNLESVYSQMNQFNSMTSSSVRNLQSHRIRYMSTVDKLNKRMRFLSRLRTILGNKSFRPYKMP